MGKSRRHHYVPQFLTRGFLDDKGKIQVYDKIKDRFYEGNAVNLFLENDRNTFINFEGVDDDIIEKVYASFDGLFSGVLAEISSTNKVSNENYEALLFLAYISKWRVPQYDESFKDAKSSFTVDELGLGFKGSDDRRININLEEYFGLDMQQELKRILLAVQPFRFREDFKKLKQNSFLINTHLPSFIGDCPFVEATLISDEIFEDFIFPVTKDLTLVYSTRIDRNEIQDFLLNGNEENIDLFLRDFSTGRDVSLLALAERNVACSDPGYLQHIVNSYKTVKARGTNTPFNLTIFNLLYRFKEYANR
jgi:hypothetical protein